jgi:hypothetical protein
MWTADGKLLLRLQGGDGGPFAKLMNSLLVTESISLGISLADVDTTLRTTIGDGGADAVVRRTAVAADSTGWFGVPSVWQYKGTEYAEISDTALKKEITKHYAADLISKGYGYRFCICDDPPAQTVSDWETLLTAEAKKINPAAPPARVLNTSRIAEWVNKYAAIYVEFFDPMLFDLHTLNTWGLMARAETRTYVPVPGWAQLADQIRQHVNFTISPADAVVPVLGASGVGKTRLCYEVLLAVPGVQARAVYTKDEQKAMKVAAALLSRPDKQAIIVADECSLSARVKLEDMLRGVRDRVRVIAIDNSAIRHAGDAPPPWLEAIPGPTVLAILEANFPAVPDDRRKSYAALSGGFVRIAADMCHHHDQIVKANGFSPVVPRLEDYMRTRLSPQQLECIEALAMVKRVGSREDVRSEIEALCGFLGLDPKAIDVHAMQIKDAPGFVEIAGRYIAVTPSPIAQVAFQNGYRKWISPDPKTRLLGFPAVLLDSFRERVADYGTVEVRREVGEIFRSEMTSLAGHDLANRDKIQRIVTLVETDPSAFFHSLCQVIVNASEAELASNTGEFRDRWGPRRDLVWMCERLARFPEHFHDAEAILWRLAQVETEPNIGNNATATWQQMFWIFLSGTSIPFPDRLPLLEERLRHDVPKLSAIAFGAFAGIFGWHLSRIRGRDVVAGRIAPSDWRPANETEHGNCIRLSVDTLGRVLKLGPSWRTELAMEVLHKHLGTLVRSDHAATVRDLYATVHLTPSQETRLRVSLEDQLHYDGVGRRGAMPDATKKLIQEWIGALSPKDLTARVAAIVAVDPWHYEGTERKAEKTKWETEVASVATGIVGNPACLDGLLDLLHSPEARSAGVLSRALGRADGAAIFLPPLTADAAKRQSASVARWYFLGILETHPEQNNLVSGALDSIEKEAPKAAYEIAMTLGPPVDAVTRVLRLVDQKRITPQYLRGFIYGGSVSELEPDRFQALLERLIPPPADAHEEAIAAAVDLLHSRLRRKEAVQEFADRPPLREITFVALEQASQLAGKSYEWAHTLKAVSSLDLLRASSIAASGLVSEEGITRGKDAIEVLGSLASQDAGTVMEAIGRVMLDPQRGMWFYFGTYRPLFAALPPQVVVDWLKRVGVEGARRIARHLPPPEVDKDGRAVVPELTEAVLELFEADDRTFREFCSGVHSFQIYSGDIASQHEAEARHAELFLNHRLRRIKEWAHGEREDALRQAAEERRRVAEEATE